MPRSCSAGTGRPARASRRTCSQRPLRARRGRLESCAPPPARHARRGCPSRPSRCCAARCASRRRTTRSAPPSCASSVRWSSTCSTARPPSTWPGRASSPQIRASVRRSRSRSRCAATTVAATTTGSMPCSPRSTRLATTPPCARSGCVLRPCSASSAATTCRRRRGRVGASWTSPSASRARRPRSGSCSRWRSASVPDRTPTASTARP